MKKHFFCLLSITMLFSSVEHFGQVISYPVTRQEEQSDLYHGITVKDPYRWLEDDHAAETISWVKSQNEVTMAYLDKIPYRKRIFDDLEKAYNYPKYSSPARKGSYFYFFKNNGLQNQAVLYRQTGPDGNPELVLDPNQLSQDGTTKLTNFRLSKNGAYAVFGFSHGGSDWQKFRVMDMKSLQFLEDLVDWVKISGAAWQGDGFYYSRYPKPEGSVLASVNENHQVFFHKIGTSQTEDLLVYEDAANPQRFHFVSTTEDEEYAILSVSDRGNGKDGNSVWYMKKGETSFKPLIKDITNDRFSLIDHTSNVFLVETNQNAPNGKVVGYDIAQSKWFTVLPEKPEPLQGAGTAGNRLFAVYSKDVSARVYVYDLKGSNEREVTLPGLGAVSGFGGEKEDTSVFYTYTSFNYPPTIFSYDLAKGESRVFRKPEVSFNPEDYETEQVFYQSKDGTRVPMFLTYKKGLKRNGQNPTILYGYGGFNVSLDPGFSPVRIPFLDQGGIYAQVNLRGGSEYGETWHEQGMKLKKQNVFDDFIAAAEYLIAQKYTSASRLAAEGGSNGGLLVGAVINQRPGLFKVALPAVGVMDMLRFQKFTIGWNWIADYGSSENPEEFKVLYGYSPLHNIKAGAGYPATLVTTADHDDRVVPAHSFKYIAELQTKAGKSSENPLLIRIDTNSGHGASNTRKALETRADIYAFMFYNMQIEWHQE